MRTPRPWLVATLVLATAVPVTLAACGEKKPATDPSGLGADGGADTGAVSMIPQGPDPIDTGLTQIAAQVAADMQPEGVAIRQNLAPGQPTKLDVTLQGDECYAIVAYAAPGTVQDLDVAMLFQGQPIAQDMQNDTSAVLGLPPSPICPPATTPVTLAVSAKQGAAAFGLRLYSKPNPQLKAGGGGGGGTGGGDSAPDLVTKNAATLAKGMSPEGTLTTKTLAEGETTSVTVTLQAGKCYTAIAASQKDGIKDVEMRLLMPPFFTVEVEKDKRTDNVAVIGSPTPQCPITFFPVPYRLDVTAKKGAGPVAVQLFSKNK
jgi:hypothetical protein